MLADFFDNKKEEEELSAKHQVSILILQSYYENIQPITNKNLSRD